MVRPMLDKGEPTVRVGISRVELNCFAQHSHHHFKVCRPLPPHPPRPQHQIIRFSVACAGFLNQPPLSCRQLSLESERHGFGKLPLHAQQPSRSGFEVILCPKRVGGSCFNGMYACASTL